MTNQMNALGDWRYVNAHDIKSVSLSLFLGGGPGLLALMSHGFHRSFGGERNRREAMSTGWIGEEWRANYSVTARVPYLHRQSPHGLVERRQDGAARFLVEPRRGLASQPSDLDLDGAISFVHGGIIPEYLDTIEDRDGVSLRRCQGSREWWSERGPMWNRDWALHDEPEVCRRVDRTLERLRVRRVVMGHTPHFEGIVSRCRGKILLIDTGTTSLASLSSSLDTSARGLSFCCFVPVGISRAYGGAHSFLDVRHTLSPSSTVDGDWHEREVVKAVYEHRENGLPGEQVWLEFE